MVAALVKQMRVYDKKRIEVVFNFQEESDLHIHSGGYAGRAVM